MAFLLTEDEIQRVGDGQPRPQPRYFGSKSLGYVRRNHGVPTRLRILELLEVAVEPAEDMPTL